MGRSRRHRGKHEKCGDGELQLHESYELSSARTRPFSYDEIMFKRNNKKLNENAETVKEGNTEAVTIANESLIQNDINVLKSKGGHKHGKDFSPGRGEHLSEELEKRSSHKKVENVSRRNDSLSKQKIREDHKSDKRLKSEVRKEMGSKDEGMHEKKIRENHNSGKRLKSEVRKEMGSKDEGMQEKQIRDNHNSEKRLRSEVRKEMGSKEEIAYEKQIPVKTKKELPIGGSENLDSKKHSRDLVERDRHESRSEGKYERDSKRKNQTRDDEQTRERNTTKRHDRQKGHALETSDRKDKKESSGSHFDESYHKRRRSRSQNHEDRHRRSISPSQRTHKHASFHVSNHEHGVKRRSGRQHSDERSRMTSNGSGGNHRRYGGSTSGLGGYSPRKRKTDAAIRVPSPAHHRSTEKRTAKWDLAVAETENMVSASVSSSNLHESSQTFSLSMNAVVNDVPSVSMAGKPLFVASTSSLLSTHTVSFDSVQLTEATRPKRRLYVENVPASASEKAIMESFNNFLLSSGVNRIRGTKPCISCIVSLCYTF